MLERPRKLKSYRFDQLADQINNRVIPAEVDVERYVGLEHLDSDSLRIRRWGEPSEVESTKLRFRPGDIIFGKRRVYQRKVALADTVGICSAHAMVLRARPDAILPAFLPFFMQSDLFMERAISISVGSLSPTINWKALAKEKFILPPIQEQERLVEVLRASSCNLDSLFDLAKKTEDLIESLILEKMEIRVIANPENYKGKFELTTGQDIYAAKSGNGEPKFDEFGDTMFFKVADFSRNSDHRQLCNAETWFHAPKNPPIRIFQPGTVIFPKRGASIFLNKIGILTQPAALDPNLMALEPDTSTASAEYLMWFFKGVGLWRFADTTSVPQLNHKHLKPVPVPLPSLDEQADLCRKLSQIADALSETRRRLIAAQEAHVRIREHVCSAGEVNE